MKGFVPHATELEGRRPGTPTKFNVKDSPNKELCEKYGHLH